MQESPKDKKVGSVADDQKEHGYYYDDAHGYESYDPEEEESEEEDRDKTSDVGQRKT